MKSPDFTELVTGPEDAFPVFKSASNSRGLFSWELSHSSMPSSVQKKHRFPDCSIVDNLSKIGVCCKANATSWGVSGQSAYHQVTSATPSVPYRGLSAPVLPYSPSGSSSVWASYSSASLPVFCKSGAPCGDIWGVLSPACCFSALSHALPVTASASWCVSDSCLLPVALQGASSTLPL